MRRIDYSSFTHEELRRVVASSTVELKSRFQEMPLIATKADGVTVELAGWTRPSVRVVGKDNAIAKELNAPETTYTCRKCWEPRTQCVCGVG